MIRSILYESFLRFEWDENKDDSNRKNMAFPSRKLPQYFPMKTACRFLIRIIPARRANRNERRGEEHER